MTEQSAADRSERHLRETLDALALPATLHHVSGRWWTNRAYRDLTGTDGSTPPVDDWHPEDRPLARAAVRRAMAGGVGVHQEFRLRAAGGTYRRMRGSLNPFGPSAPGWFVGTAVDVDDLHRAEARVRSAFQSDSSALVFADEQARLLSVNPAFCRLVGRGHDELIGTSINRLMHPDDRAVSRSDGIRRVNRMNAGAEVRLVRPDGEVRWVIGRAVPMFGEPGDDREWFLNLVDITDRRQAEERFRVLAETVPDVIYRIRHRPSPAIEYLSPVFHTMFGLHRRDMYEQPDLAFQVVHPDDRGELDRLLAGAEDPALTRVRRGDGRWIWVEHRVRHERDGQGQLLATTGVARDVTEVKRAEEDLAHRATHDPLTGLPNRALFLEHLAKAIEQHRRDEGALLAVLYLDLDRFKVVNDSLGHAAGDDLLIEVAHRLASVLRAGDTLARLGGDEFTVVLPHLGDAMEAVHVAERIRAACSEPFEVDGRELITPVSVGVAFATDGRSTDEPPTRELDLDAAATAADLLRHADAALALAKERGRNRVELFDDALRNALVERLDRETALRRSVANGEIEVHYQPEIDLVSGRVVAVEALARWRRPGHGLVLPADFVDLAEETGLVVPLGQVVLDRAAALLARWQRAGRTTGVTVNVSARQLVEPAFAASVRSTLAATGCEPSGLCLEVTESVFVTDLDAAVEVLEALRVLGVRISVDDFGTGFSSLAYLHRLPLDELKIDRTFVATLAGTSPAPQERRAIVRAVVEMARALGLTTVAEGVETVEQFDAVRALGCDRAQGWLFARAVPDGEIDEVVDALGRASEGRQ